MADEGWKRRNELRQGSRAQPIPGRRRFDGNWRTGPNGYCECTTNGMADDCDCPCHDLRRN